MGRKMLTRKDAKRIDKQILKDNLLETEEDYVDINVKIEDKSQLFSSYNYDNDTLNKDLGEYLWERAKLVPINKDINIKIHTNQKVEKQEVKKAIQTHLKADYIEAKESLKKTNFVSLSTLMLGILFLALYLVFSSVSTHFILITITEIMAWVFVWEAVDCFAFKRTVLKRECLKIQKLYSAKIQIEQANK